MNALIQAAQTAADEFACFGWVQRTSATTMAGEARCSKATCKWHQKPVNNKRSRTVDGLSNVFLCSRVFPVPADPIPDVVVADAMVYPLNPPRLAPRPAGTPGSGDKSGRAGPAFAV